MNKEFIAVNVLNMRYRLISRDSKLKHKKRHQSCIKNHVLKYKRFELIKAKCIISVQQ